MRIILIMFWFFCETEYTVFVLSLEIFWERTYWWSYFLNSHTWKKKTHPSHHSIIFSQPILSRVRMLDFVTGMSSGLCSRIIMSSSVISTVNSQIRSISSLSRWGFSENIRCRSLLTTWVRRHSLNIRSQCRQLRCRNQSVMTSRIFPLRWSSSSMRPMLILPHKTLSSVLSRQSISVYGCSERCLGRSNI